MRTGRVMTAGRPPGRGFVVGLSLVWRGAPVYGGIEGVDADAAGGIAGGRGRSLRLVT